MKVFCNNCGTQLEVPGGRTEIFCNNCGARQYIPNNPALQRPQIADDIRNVNVLISCAESCLKEKNWDYASAYIEKAFLISPNNPQAYLCKLLAELRISTKWDLKDFARPIDSMESYRNAVNYADASLREFLIDSAQRIKDRYYEGAYNSAYNKMTGKDCKQDFLGAARIFEGIAWYKDSATLAQECRAKERKHQEDLRKMKSRIRKRKIKGFIGTLIGIAIVAVSAFGVFKFFQKKTSMDVEIIEFGSYEQDANFSNGKEDLEWIVVNEDDDKMLLVTKNIIEYRQYHENLDVGDEVTWDKCDLREWLNNEFYETAFDDNEKDRIIATDVIKEDIEKNDLNIDVSSRDKVFLLSSEEIKNCYPLRKGEVEDTVYAKKSGEYYRKDFGSGYWLRYPVTINCDVPRWVGKVNWHSFIKYYYGVRPAIWIEK